MYSFIMMLFQGFVSPIISNGLRTMSQFEITLPQIRRINVSLMIIINISIIITIIIRRRWWTTPQSPSPGTGLFLQFSQI